MSALVIMSNVWNSEGHKEYLGEVFYYGFSICRDMCDFDLYFENPVKQESSSVLYLKGCIS